MTLIRIVNFFKVIIIIFCITFSNLTIAQISQGGTPPSFSSNNLKNNFQEIIVQKPNVEQLLLEDVENDKQAEPLRFAKLLEVNFDINNSGTWTDIPGKGRIWRLKITSDGALAIGIYYNNFRIPQGGQLYLYNEDKSQVIGAFTEANNTENKLFATELIQGETTILEYFEPYGVFEKPEIGISEISYAYRAVNSLFTKGTDDFGDSGPCEVNVNCPEGENWQDQKRSVARVLVKRSGSSMWCTGSLVNNTMEDFMPYFLTADHCGKYSSEDDINQWIFYFNYESVACPNPEEEPSSNTIVGATKKASFGWEAGSDFFLILLNQGIPSSYNPYFGGWNRNNSSSPNGVTIHHPEGDIKKISTYTIPITSSTWGDIPNTHWKVNWAATVTNHGVTEGCSSGCPLYDNLGRVIGTLTGGQSSCTHLNYPDFFGKFSYSWDSCGTDSTTQLKYWLDPIDIGVNQIDGLDILTRITNFKIDKVAIAPNPTNGECIIYLDNQESNNVEINVFNLLGKKVPFYWKEINSTNYKINLSENERGMYLIQIICSEKIYNLKAYLMK
jgi:hypothetical protein